MKVGFTCGSFDLCHAGHIRMFKECRDKCDKLIVAVQSDPTLDRETKNKPIMSLNERLEIVNGIKYVDEVRHYDTEEELVEILKELKPDIRFIGEDWKGKKYTGCELPIKVIFNSRQHKYSSSELRKRIYEAEKLKYGRDKRSGRKTTT